jgi:hypothetical protein
MTSAYPIFGDTGFAQLKTLAKNITGSSNKLLRMPFGRLNTVNEAWESTMLWNVYVRLYIDSGSAAE